MPKVVAIIIVAAALAAPLAAQPARKLPMPPAFQKLASCRAIADDAARLACLDHEVATMVEAEARSELVILDQGQLRSTRKSLFGLTLPRLPFLDDGAQDPPSRTEGKVQAISMARDGKWLVTLEDAVWRTTDIADLQSTPKIGDAVLIRRGSLGAFLLSVNGRRALRALRVR